jgi:hypothetical protein
MNIIGHDTLATIPTDEALERFAPDVERRMSFEGFKSPFSAEQARWLIGFEARWSWRDSR